MRKATRELDCQGGSENIEGDATVRPVWHTFRVDASFHQQRGITGIGLVLQATNKPGRDGTVLAKFSEAYTGLPVQIGEQFAVLRAMEIASERGYRLLRVRSDYNQMRKALKHDYEAGTFPDKQSLRVTILRLAQEFDQIKFAWIPRRKNHEAHCLARSAVLHGAMLVREDMQRFFEW